MGSGVFVSVITALNPILLLIVGYVLNLGIEHNKRELEKNKVELEKTSLEISNLKTAAETASITIQQRVDKVKVISDFLNDLSGPDERRRKLAIEAILIALPDEAPRLVLVIEKFDAGNAGGQAKDATAARDALDTVRAKLVSDMFSGVKAIRVSALTTLRRNWLDDPILIAGLLKEADREMTEAAARGGQTDDQGTASLYNLVIFLGSIRVPADQALKERVRKFLVSVQNAGSVNTKTLAATTISRFQ